MSVLVVAGAPVVDADAYRSILGGAEVRIAVDRGADLCRTLGQMPDLFVGDADSVQPDTLEEIRAHGVECIMLPEDKDVTDLSVALETAAARYRGLISVTAVLGGRTDHLLVALGDLLAMPGRGPIIVEPMERGWVLREPESVALSLAPVGSVVSVIAGPGGATVTLNGFKWPLVHAELPPFSGRGLSNVTHTEPATVTLHRGSVVVLAPFGAMRV